MFVVYLVKQEFDHHLFRFANMRALAIPRGSM